MQKSKNLLNLKSSFGFIQAPAFSKNGAGFTLIEILIVLTLIGILSLFMFTNFGSIKKARDARRKADLKQIEKSLEQYRSDNGIYPSSGGITNLVNCPTTPPATFFGNAVVTPPPAACTTVYLNKVPIDPGGSSYWNSGSYLYYSLGGERYYLVACAEDAGDKDAVSQSNLQAEIVGLFGSPGVDALMINADFANSCVSDYGYLITGQ